MRRLLLMVLLVAACARPVASPSTTPEPTVTPPSAATEIPTRQPAPAPPPPEVPMPLVTVESNPFRMSPLGSLHAAPVAPMTAWLFPFGEGLMNFLDKARGNGPWKQTGPVLDDEWNSRIFPGAFQQIARAAAHAKPPQGRFFHLDTITADAAYAVPWGTDAQFVDVTIRFRDHAETPPADEELFYIWHARLATNPRGPTGFADGYDGVTLKRFTSNTPYWTRAALENEAASALDGYLWGESYAPGASQRYVNVSDTTPFWHARIAAINELNARFIAGVLRERRFESATVRIDDFEPLTYFGGGIVSVTLRGTLVEASAGTTRRVPFTQPMKFFRYGSDGHQLSGWTAMDAFQDGMWVSGGDLGLKELNTSYG